MSSKRANANPTGNGINEDDFARMKERMDKLEAENTALKERQAALKFKLLPKGETMKNGKVRTQDVLSVSGGAIGYPENHTYPRWVNMGTEMGTILAYIKDNPLSTS